MLNDLLLNDDSIFGMEPNGDRFYVRRFMSHKEDVIQKLLKNILESDHQNSQSLSIREYSLKILFWLHQFDANKMGPLILESLYRYRADLVTKIE